MESPLSGKQVHRASAKSPTSSRLDSRGGPGRGLNAALYSQFVNATFGSWLLFSVLEEAKERCVWLRAIFCFLLVCWDQVVTSNTENVLLCLNSRDHPQIHRMVRSWAVGNNLQLEGPVPKGDPWRELGPRTRGPGHDVTSEGPGPWGLCQPLPSSSCQY